MIHRIQSGLAALVFALAGGAPASSETLRIAYAHMPPMVYRDQQGHLHGFAVEVLREAARREGILLEWRPGGDTEQNNRALLQGSLDLVATGVPSLERRRLFYVSAPWWSSDLIGVVRSQSPIRRAPDLNGATLAVPAPVVAVAAVRFPGSRLLKRRSATQAAEAVCKGDADAALFASMYLPELLAAGEWPCQGVSLRTVDPQAAIDLVVLSRREVAKSARALRHRIDELTVDGTLAAIALRHPPVSTPQATRMAELLRIRYERRLWQMVLAAVAAIVLIGVAFMIRQRRIQHELRRSHAALLESEQRFRKVIAEAPLPIILHNADGEVLQTSRAWAEITGYSPATVRTMADWTEKAYGERNDDPESEGEHVIRTAAGEERVWYFASAPVGEDSRGRRLVVSMAADITDLKGAQEQVRVLSGLLPICAACKQIRDEHGRWHQLERFIHDHSEAQFSHGLCPACLPKYALPQDRTA